MEREYRYDHHFCKECKKRFDCKYTSADFCQTKCRVAYHRKRNASEKLARKILDDLYKLSAMPHGSESVSKAALRIASVASQIADDWEFIRPL